SAQIVASRCIGLSDSDEVIVPAFTWISTANAAEHLGARPVFVDIDLDTFNLDASLIDKTITHKTKAIFPVNLFGLPADLAQIQNIALKNNLSVVEDCACSLGGSIQGRHTGTFGDCGCFSLHPRKSITTGEGGVLVTSDEKIYKLARSLREHGADISDYERHKKKAGFLLPAYKYLGYNFRLTDIQAAIGVAQMKKIDEILQKRKELAQIYSRELASCDFLMIPAAGYASAHAYQAYVCLFMPQEISRMIETSDYSLIDGLHEKRNNFMMRLGESGIATRPGTHAVHIQEYYARKYFLKPFDFPKAYIADKLSIAFPLYPGMSEAEQSYVIENIKKCAV
ncbi:DegT/DnrJ/EryC1/StrS family aminotransferase, partial [Elusimicrobiota bacterium]